MSYCLQLGVFALLFLLIKDLVINFVSGMVEMILSEGKLWILFEILRVEVVFLLALLKQILRCFLPGVLFEVAHNSFVCLIHTLAQAHSALKAIDARPLLTSKDTVFKGNYFEVRVRANLRVGSKSDL